MKSFEIKKADPEKQYVFGWASISKTNTGDLLEDYQGDIIEPEELEKAAYNFVLNFGDTGERHDPEFRKKGKLITSIVFTDDVKKALGLETDSLPTGWFVGFHIEDKETWEKLKKGDYKMFSIEGQGKREPVKKMRYYNDIRRPLTYNTMKERMTEWLQN